MVTTPELSVMEMPEPAARDLDASQPALPELFTLRTLPASDTDAAGSGFFTFSLFAPPEVTSRLEVSMLSPSGDAEVPSPDSGDDVSTTTEPPPPFAWRAPALLMVMVELSTFTPMAPALSFSSPPPEMISALASLSGVMISAFHSGTGI